jgi:hypothetical protein
VQIGDTITVGFVPDAWATLLEAGP